MDKGMNGQWLQKELSRREICCEVCKLGSWEITTRFDDKGVLGFEGECKRCDAIIRGYLPTFTSLIKITHNGIRPSPPDQEER